MADLEVNRRLKRIIEDVFHMTPLDFSSRYSDKKGQKTYNIINEKNGLSNKMLDEILYAYPEINKVWLLTGEGEVLLSDNTPTDTPKDSNIYERLITQLEERISDNKKTIEIQEVTIKSLIEQIELLKLQKKTDAPQDGGAMNVAASGFSDK